MPNIAAQFGNQQHVFFSRKSSPEVKTSNLVSSFGYSIIDEKLMDAATVLAASGTAFALRYIRASMQAGLSWFDWQTASYICSNGKGNAAMIMEEWCIPNR
jgi:pyrroline-5-carboxylate reductase